MAYSMAKTETYIRKIVGLRLLKIDPGRYLAINEEGEYVISTKPQPIRGRPYGEGLRTPLVLGGAPAPPPGNPKYRVLMLIWVAGDIKLICVAIRHEDEECKNSKFVGYLPLVVSKLLVSKFPKENPQKMSANQIRVEVKKQTFNKMFADIGIEAPKTDNDNAQVRFDKMLLTLRWSIYFLNSLLALAGCRQGRAEVTIGKSDIRISSIADELKASYEDLEEWKATMKEREASFNLIMGKSSLADELEAQKEDEKWAEQTVDRAKVEGISANMSIDRKRAVSEEAPDIDIDNKKHKLQGKEEK